MDTDKAIEKLEHKIEEFQKAETSHLMEFAAFKEVSGERYVNLKADITEIKDMLKSYIKESKEHESAQSTLLLDLNNRITEIESNKAEKQELSEVSQEVSNLNTKITTERKIFAGLLTAATIVAAALAGPLGEAFTKLFGG